MKFFFLADTFDKMPFACATHTHTAANKTVSKRRKMQITRIKSDSNDSICLSNQEKRNDEK